MKGTKNWIVCVLDLSPFIEYGSRIRIDLPLTFPFSVAAESPAEVEGTKNGCRHGRRQGQEEEVVKGKIS
jgi:hypothetical protein